MARYNARMTSIQFADATGTPITFTLNSEQANFTGGPMSEGNRESIAKYHRGSYDGSVPGNDQQQSISLTVELKNQALTDGSAGRIMDWIQKTGTVASGVTTDSGGLEWRFKITISMNDTITTADLVYPNCRIEGTFGEAMEGNTITLSGVNDGAVTKT